MDIIIKHQEHGHKGSWYVENPDGGDHWAELLYRKAGTETITLGSTKVSDVLRGKSVGKLLVERSVEYARAHGIKILPVCPFTVVLFDKTPEYADVRAEHNSTFHGSTSSQE